MVNMRKARSFYKRDGNGKFATVNGSNGQKPKTRAKVAKPQADDKAKPNPKGIKPTPKKAMRQQLRVPDGVPDDAIELDERGYINDVAAPSAEADFHTPEVVNPKVAEADRAKARQRANDLFWRATQAAPEIREAIRGVVSDHGGVMEREYDEHTGAPTAVKTEHSLFRKLQSEMLEAGVTDPGQIELKDSVRFTSVFDDEGYSDAITALRTELTRKGFRQVKPPPELGNGGWGLGSYRGLNMAFEREDGLAFELQVHTQKSLAAANLNHAYYDITRMDTLSQVDEYMKSGAAEKKTGISTEGHTPESYLQACTDVSLRNAEAVPVPKGVPIFGDRKLKKELVPAQDKTENRSATTGKTLRVPVEDYGMTYDEGGEAEVEEARQLSDDDWEEIPVTTVKPGTELIANELDLKRKSIDKVVGGSEPFREGYVVKLWKAEDGRLHIVDGHHRVAMYAALKKPMPSRILTRKKLDELKGE